MASGHVNRINRPNTWLHRAPARLSDLYGGSHHSKREVNRYDRLRTAEGNAVHRTSTLRLGSGAKLFHRARRQRSSVSFVVNRTNGKRIAFMHGDLTEHRIGKRITLFSEMVDYRGAPVMAIRVKPAAVSDAPIKPAVQQPAAAGMNADIGF